MSPDGTRALSVAGSRPLEVGVSARVEFASGRTWSGRVSYVSGDLVGLKSATIVPGAAAGQTVTLVIGAAESKVAAEARILSASGSFLRLTRRESSEGLERRRALRVPVTERVEISYLPGHAGPRRVWPAEMTDMSASGCALRSGDALPIGGEVVVTFNLVGTEVALSGKVVRTWRSPDSNGEHAGIQFDAPSPGTAALINRYLLLQLRETSNPGAGSGHRAVSMQ